MHCQGRSPDAVAAEIGSGGAPTLKRVVAESVNERYRPIARDERTWCASPHIFARSSMTETRAREVAETTLREVRSLMHTTY